MKKSLLDIANQMHRADPTARFAFKFWDGEDVVYGDRPEVILWKASLPGCIPLELLPGGDKPRPYIYEHIKP